MSVPSGDVVSSGHHDLDLALKLSIIIVKDGLNPLTKLSKFSKFDKNYQIQLLIDLEINQWQ